MDFGALPPEINSGRMYAGPGSAPLLAAASAWVRLAGELRSASAGHQSVIADLAEGRWLGPAAARMVTAVTPMLVWLQTTAEQAEHTATQISAAAAAYDSAYAMMVPPSVIAANRTQLASLVATNALGVNTAAIAAAEAQYSQMWAQDAVAMYGYAAQSAAATRVMPFGRPTPAVNPTGQDAQHAAAAQAGGASGSLAVESTVSQALAATPGTLQAMSSPAQTGAGIGPLLPSTLPDIFGLAPGDVSNAVSNLLSSSGSPMSVAAMTQVGADAAVMHSVANGGVVGPYGGVIPGWGEGLLSPAGIGPEILAPGSGISMVQPGGLAAGSLAGQVSPAVGQASAGIGQGSLVGAMSVPQSWATSAALASPAAGVPAPTASAAAPAVGAPGVPGVPAGATGMRGIGFAAPRYGFKVAVMPRPVVAG